MRTKATGSRQYFLTYLLPPTYTESELNKFREEIATLVTRHKGKVVDTQEWGKRQTAYKIRHAGKWQNEAVYTHLTIEIEPGHINLLEKDIYLNGNIMRHLLVLTDKTEEMEALA